MSRHLSVRMFCACAILGIGGCSLSPQPLTEEQLAQIAIADRELIFESQETIKGELTLDVAMAMALKYNLENRVKLLEEAVATRQLDLAQMDLLPSLAATAGYLDRDNLNASKSISVQTGQQSLEPSTSQDTQKINASGRLTWNLLDFGVSYLQAKQDADRFLIAKKAREKVMLSLLKEVRAAYWKAIAMEQMRSELDAISAEVDELLDYWQSIREQQLRPPVAVLIDIRSLIETRQQLDEIRRNINTASARLANLINAESYQALKFPQITDFPKLVEITDDIERLEVIALANSADYTSEIYKVRIEQRESRKAMLRLLPGLEFSYGENYDDNSFLLNNTWGEFGLNLTGDITQLFFIGRINKFRETSEQLSINRKLAINMAVITGVHISWQDYRNSLVQLKRARYLQEIDNQISLLTDNAQKNSRETGAAAIQGRLRAFRSRISQMQSYADAQESYGELIVSLGVNPIPEDYQRKTVTELATVISEGITEGVFPFTTEGERILAEKARFNEWIALKEKESSALAAQEEARLMRDEQLAEERAQKEAADILAKQQQQEAIAKRDAAERERAEEAARKEKQLVAQEAVRQRAREAARAMELASIERERKNQPVQASTLPPSVGQFLQDFWTKYFPRPSMEDYLVEFVKNLPDGPSRASYMRQFIERLPDVPDREAYLHIFLESMRSGPSVDQYTQEFRSLHEGSH